MRRNVRTRIGSILLAALMLLTLLPANAVAAKETEGSMSQADLVEKINDALSGDTVTLTGNVDVTNPIIINKKLTLDLDGKTISNTGDIWNVTKHDWSLISVREGGDLTITGDGTLQAKKDDCYAVDVMDGGICTIKNGTFVGNIHAVYVLEGMLVVNGGAFSVQQKYTDPSKADEFVLNCFDDHYRDGSASILVTGGTFKNFNPSNCQAEGAGTSFMSADCKSEESTSEGVTTYTVEKNQTITVKKPTSPSGDTVSATVGGVSIPNNGQSGNTGVETSGQTLTVDAMVTPQPGTTVTTANVTVGGGALTAVKEAANVSNLAIKTNVGILTVSQEALDAIVTAATIGSSVSDVTLSIEVSELSDEHSVTYDFTATNARGVEVFDQKTASEDATITVTVDAPSGAKVNDTVYIYYIDGDIRTLEDTQTVAEDGTVTWDVTHFSQREVTNTQDEATYTNNAGNEVTGTLAEAVQNAKENTTIILNRDVTLTAPVDVGKQVTLDLNGHNITEAAESSYSADYLVSVKRGGDLTIENNSSKETGAITSDTILCGVKMTISDEGDNGTAAKLTVDGGTIQGKTYGIAGNGTRHNTEITINDGIIKTASDDGTGIYHPQDGSLTVNGGRIIGNTGIEIRSGSLTVTGGTISGGTNESPTVGGNGNGTTTSNTGIAIAQHTTKKPITVNITGGIITGSAAVYESNPQKNDGTDAVSVTIKDVRLDGDLKSSGFGSVTVDNTTINGDVDKTGTGSMSVIESTITGNVTKGESNSGSLGFVDSTITGTVSGDAAGSNVIYVNTTVNGTLRETELTSEVAMVGGETYDNFAAALAAVKPGDTLTLLKDIEYNTTITLPANVTFDGRKKTITCNTQIKNGAFITVGGDNTIVENLTVNTAGKVKHGVQFYCMNNGKLSNVTVNGGYYTSVIINGATNVILENCTLNPDTNAYANIEFGMGGGVATIPSMTIDNVTFGNAKAAQIWVDDDTVSSIKNNLGKEATNGDVLTEVKENIINKGSDDVVISIEFTPDEVTNEEIEGTGSSTPGGGTGEPTEAEPFEDVDENDWFYNDVVYVYENGLMQGTSDTAFSPKKEMDRAMLVTTLYRMEGEPSVADVDVPFTDVTEGYYVDAVAWAYANNIVSGYENNTFQPKEAITREQYVTILHRYAQFKAMDVTGDADLSAFTDAEKVSGWAEEAMIWAVDTELMQGVTETTIAPRNTAQRCQGAALLTRFHQLMV